MTTHNREKLLIGGKVSYYLDTETEEGRVVTQKVVDEDGEVGHVLFGGHVTTKVPWIREHVESMMIRMYNQEQHWIAIGRAGLQKELQSLQRDLLGLVFGAAEGGEG